MWLHPAFAIMGDIFNGPAAHMAVAGPISGGPTRSEIRRLLNAQGVDVWGFLFSRDLELLMFSVKEGQAKRAYRLLEGANIGIQQAPAWVTENTNQAARGDLTGRIFGAIGWE